ncbi:DUF4253 domain-containing protein [Jidongwangia harbinensis]|uniref:DUF4253 domain-containing protein n=1 Tax=Jidongwangia harbinensis TaxID=2878561 RepID=UPI001CD9395A|nr:DUF4253 domain-containing protein [Jidongwangia harbinensis]MCA2218106.1 DUF4253 domain-containing protein [Jidongwangia harbinensis]
MSGPPTHLQEDSDGDRSPGLPPGRTVHETRDGGPAEPLLWISDDPPAAGLWGALHAVHGQTGRWPLILGSSPYSPGSPWTTGDLDRSLVETGPGDHDAAALLAGWWVTYATAEEDEDAITASEQVDVTAPFGDRWPGLAPPGTPQEDPAVRAGEFADHLVADSWLTAPRLGLCVSARGADAAADLGWGGALNYDNDTAKFSTVLRSWEGRFGARVVGIGPAELYLSVAAPPTDPDHALLVAAEHFAFCPDNVWQSDLNTLVRYAGSITDRAWWSFWWD